MGNPLKLEVELSSQQSKQPDDFQRLDSSELSVTGDQKAPLLATKSRAEDHHSEALVGGGEAHNGKTNGKVTRVVKFEEDVKPLVPDKSSNSGNDRLLMSDSRATQSERVPQLMEEITPDVIREMEIKYAAYVRDDIFGTFGRGPIPTLEKIFVGLALVTIVPIRLVLMLLILLTYYFICKMCTLFRRPSEEEGQENYGYLTGVRRHVIVFSGRWLARSLLFTLGFYHIKVTERTPDVMQRLHLGLGKRDDEDNEGLLEASRGYPGAIVSNHVSYLDILYHMSASFPSFVAKRSVAKLPLVGLMSKCMGCLYVQRESKSPNFKGVSGIVTQRLQAAHSNPDAPVLLLFPEGTTSNGDYLLPFKTGAFLTGTPVLPVILKYPYSRFSPAWETITGVRHVILLLCQLVNHLEVTRLPVYYPSAKECIDPKTYANNVRTLMSTEGDLITSDVGLYEKRVYHAALAGKVFTRSDSSLR